MKNKPVSLHYKKYSSANSDEYLIILHGLFGMLDNWHNMAKKISQYINVVTVDARNHGKSPHTNEFNYDLVADDLVQLLDDLGLSSAVFLGHSMGGKAVMKLADKYPDRVEKLIVVDIAPKEYKGSHEVYFNALKNIDFSRIRNRKEANLALEKSIKNDSVRLFLLKNLEKRKEGYGIKFNLESLEKNYSEIKGSIGFSWLITVPSLFVYGEKSDYIQEADKVAIEETFTDVEFESIPKAGHWVHADNPDYLMDVLLGFLS